MRHEQQLGHAGAWFWTDVVMVAGAAMLALGAYLIETAGWAVVIACGEFRQLAPNYASLGYGDVVISASWKLLGPLETADGMLMFGVSTAMIFAAIQRLLQARFGETHHEIRRNAP